MDGCAKGRWYSDPGWAAGEPTIPDEPEVGTKIPSMVTAPEGFKFEYLGRGLWKGTSPLQGEVVFTANT